MSDLCVLTASLLVQGKAPGWKLANPPQAAWTFLFNRQHQVDRVCSDQTSHQTNVAPNQALNRPEFSRWARNVAARPLETISNRPTSGSQLYVQRLAALQTGQIYTRLPANSFQTLWERASRQPTYEDWLRLLRHEANAMVKGQGAERMTILLGDSHAQWFPSEQLSKNQFWLNQGLSGDTTAGILKRLSLFDRTNPDAIYLMAGINDLRQGATDQEILTNLQQIMRQLRTRHPYAQVYVHSILPTRLEAIPVERIRRLNYSISQLALREASYYINLQPAFADADGHLQTKLTTDGLHLNAMGYRLWKIAIAPFS